MHLRNSALLGLVGNKSEEGAGRLAVPLCSPAGSFVKGTITAETLTISWEVQPRIQEQPTALDV